MARSSNKSSNELLREIDVDLIDRNPENPRLVFRPGELSQLTESIAKFGVQVPVSVYKDGNRFVLIDGERRWKCSIKLNRKTIPAIIQGKPDPLSNLLLMFNIHALREQWDLLTIALKLPRVVDLLTLRLHRVPNERELASETGLLQGVIRRCKLLMELPDRHKKTILAELQKPKAKQKLTEDFFIEMERSLKTVSRAMPNVLSKDRVDSVRDVLIEKYQRGIITNVVHFRMLAKIARATNVHADAVLATQALKKIFRKGNYSIEDGFRESVEEAYLERDLISRAKGLGDYLSNTHWRALDKATKLELRKLYRVLGSLIGRS
jgi:ParB/RepB/Spo0J family partition protein